VGVPALAVTEADAELPGRFMAASKVLGEESVREQSQGGQR